MNSYVGAPRAAPPRYRFSASFSDNSPAPKAFGAGKNRIIRIFESLQGRKEHQQTIRFCRPRGDFVFLSLKPSVKTLGYCQGSKALNRYNAFSSLFKAVNASYARVIIDRSIHRELDYLVPE